MKTDINEALKQELLSTLEAGISEDFVKKARKQLRDLMIEAEEELDYSIKDNLAHNLVGFVAGMAKKTVNAILEGNEDEMRRYLGCERGAWNGRQDGNIWGNKRGADQWHPVIHGTLFETGCIKLRRDIIAAHRDLITDERVKDLEEQVASLVAQVNKERDAISRLRHERAD